MQSTDDLKSFRKVIFWQRVVAFMLLVSIVGTVLFFFYNLFGSHEYQMIMRGSTFDIYMGFVIGTILLLGLGLTIYLNWALFRSAQSLNTYLFSKTIADLEEAIKYQKTFWQLMTLSPFIAIGLLILMFLGVIAVKEIIIDPQMIEESIIIG
jgi:hypothetical protein